MVWGVVPLWYYLLDQYARTTYKEQLTMKPEEILAWTEANMPDALTKNSKYVPKLTFEGRCSLLACLKMGFSRRLVAATFGINQATTSYIIRESSPHYREVRREYRDLGHDRFVAQYLTPEVLERLHAHRNDPALKMTVDEQRSINAAAANKPNPKADKYRGRHPVHDPISGSTLFIDMQWVDDPGPLPHNPFGDVEREAGWYFKVDPSSPAYESGGWQPGWWGYNEDRFTSKRQLDRLLSDIGGELL